jgi:tRNA 2-thiouridine synthesizing protein E
MTNSEAITVPHDVEGYLIKPQHGNKTIACTVAAERGIEPSTDPWIAIDFMREYYDAHGIAPHALHSIACLADKHRWGSKQAGKQGLRLLPCGHVKQPGMMRPRVWSTG